MTQYAHVSGDRLLTRAAPIGAATVRERLLDRRVNVADQIAVAALSEDLA
jgi:hypothetical protein